MERHKISHEEAKAAVLAEDMIGRPYMRHKEILILIQYIAQNEERDLLEDLRYDKV